MQSNVLPWALLACAVATVGLTVWAHKHELPTWLKEHWAPVLVMAVAGLAGVLAYFVAPSLISQATSTAAAKDPPGGVSGSDIVANLLTITALSITACLGYLCLPIDRVELRISSFTKMQLENKVLMKEEEFLNWHAQLGSEAQERPACRTIKLLLKPLVGLGGWADTTKSEELARIFQDAWPRYGKYVGDHQDDKWVRVLVGGLAVGMLAGLICLINRYLGFSTSHFDAAEFGAICSLVVANVGTGWQLIRLVSDLRSSEGQVHRMVETHIDQLAPEIKAYLKARLEQGLMSFQNEVRRHAPTPAPGTADA